MKKEPQPFKKKCAALRKRFNAAVGKLEWKDVRDIGQDTLKDLRHPREIFTLAAAVITPGGGIVYLIHRARKYRLKQKPANDDPQPP